MNIFRSIKSHFGELISAWDEFWFKPTDTATLGLIRILTGGLLFWTHLVWSFDLSSFFGTDGWIESSIHTEMHQGIGRFSLFDWIGPTWLLWIVHVLNLIAFFLLMVGFFSRYIAVWSFVAAISYASYVTPGAFFGLDSISCILITYLTLGPCGARYSIDSLMRQRAEKPILYQSSLATVSVRLIQVHLCIVYLFSGMSKLEGLYWRNGAATWFTVANVEYRSLDMTWMANFIWLAELMTHVTVFWELFYCCAIWNRLARPWMLLSAIGVHGFIGLAMGMPEFAMAMLIANLAFVAPSLVRATLDPIANRTGG